MRRDIELIREILLAIGDENISDSRELEKKLSRKWEVLDYHLNLLVNDTRLLSGKRYSGRSIELGSVNTVPPHWNSLSLTWEGNDFLDTIGDENAWKTITKALNSGAKLATLEAIKQMVKGIAVAALGLILAAGEETKGQMSDRIGGSPGSDPTAKSEDS